MAKNARRAAAALLTLLSCTPAVAGDDCSSSVSGAQDNGRQSFIQGMAGLASNNFSGRPGSFTSMACLDKFMQGNMDIMFKPPDINTLLGQVMNFACQSGSSQSMGSGASGLGSLTSLIGSLSGGLNMNGGGLNLGSLMSGLFGGSSSSSSSSSSSGGFASMFSSTSTSGSYTSSGSSYGYGTTTYPGGTAGTTGSPTATPGGNTGYAAQGADPKVDSRLLQGHSITLPGNN